MITSINNVATTVPVIVSKKSTFWSGMILYNKNKITKIIINRKSTLVIKLCWSIKIILKKGKIINKEITANIKIKIKIVFKKVND